tara:strand:+ start:2668 stop:3111 length:444 start_codon:yes stop_codon:yes gene_type:complete
VDEKGVEIEHLKFSSLAEEGSDNFVMKNAKQYQLEASGDAALSFKKGNISFDNLDDVGKLIDRKYGHGKSVFNEIDDGFGGKTTSVNNQNRANSILTQARNQVASAGNTLIKWEICTELGAKGIKKLFTDNRINIEVVFEAQIKIVN